MPNLPSSWILLILIPLAVVALGLHTREVARTGLAQPPVYAVPGESDMDYPLVGGTTIEVAGVHDLEVGDRLVRIGDRDLRGYGHLGFLGASFEEADSAGRAPVVFERDGVRMQSVLELTPFSVPWLRIPFLSIMLLLMTLILVQRAEDAFVRWSAITFATVVVGEAIFEGGGMLQATLAKSIFIFAGAIWWPMVIYFVDGLPDGGSPSQPRWRLAALAAATAALWTLPKTMYLLGGPVPSAWIPTVVSGADALTLAVPAGIFVANYRRYSELQKHRMRWFVWSAWTAGLAMFVALALPILAPGLRSLDVPLAVAGIVATVIPIGLTISILGYELFDVDRLVTSAVSYTVALVLLVGIVLSMIPWLSVWTADLFGIDAASSRLLLSMVVAAMVVPANRWLHPHFEAWFFPERRRIETGIERLIADQSDLRDLEGVVRNFAQHLNEIFAPKFVDAFVRDDERGGDGEGKAWRRLSIEGSSSAVTPGAPATALSEGLLRDLESTHVPLVISRESIRPIRWLPIVEDGEGGARSTALALPIRGAEDGEGVKRDASRLSGVLVLGQKRSGDAFSPMDKALLGSALQSATHYLRLLSEAEGLAREQHRIRELEAARLSRSRHLASASHDLRQPLHALRLFSESLLDRVQGGEERELAERIQTSAKALHEMFDSLIDASRIEQGSIDPTFSSFSLAALVERVAEESRPQALEKGLGIHVDVPSLEVESDRVLLGRILQNLLTNAIRYTEQGRIDLRARLEADAVVLEVADTGPGIAQQNQQRIFEDFVRLSPERGEHGLGLGLSIVKQLSEILGIQSTLESHPGVGSTFAIRLPRPPARARTPDRAADEAIDVFAHRPPTRGHVLVVDDDLDVLSGMKSLLSGWGYAVHLAADLDEAREVVEAGCRPRAILADYRLSQAETGVETVEALRQALGESVPALIITGSRSGELQTELERANLEALVKPVDPAGLRRFLRDALPQAPKDA